MLRLCVIFFALLLSITLSAKAESVTVFAAASLKTALDEVIQGKDVTISYAASSTIARQIELGAPADIVITANAAWMDYLEEAQRLEPGTRHDLLTNQLVLIASSDMIFITQANRPVDDILGDERLAMALVDAVPAGIYGKAALTSLGVWEGISANVVQTDNVRAALRLVAMGEVPFGIVYASDAMAEQMVQIVHSFDAEDHDPIVYPMAIVEGANRDKVRALSDHLQSAEASEAFTRHGFTVLDDTP